MNIVPVVEPDTGAAARDLDVIVVGAGISGISAGYYLQTARRGKSYAILEARDTLGGTWDLFRYPGLRSDSDLFTFGFSFRPWTEEKSIADGPSIMRYLRDTAREYGIDRHIRYGHRVTRADWDSAKARWLVDVVTGPDESPARLTCRFLYICAGYYDYAGGYLPTWPGADRFGGLFVHPQDWPEDLDYADKRIVVIGSGATAVTLVPELARTAAHVTMLQRSPTYIVSLPAKDAIAAALRRRLPSRLAHGLSRWKNVLLGMAFFQYARRRPEGMKRQILKWARAQLGPDYDVEKHFSPSYNPWDQRLCLVPDGDLFKAIKAGTASIVTDRIEAFEEDGIRLRSGEHLPADIVVTATGLKLKLLGGMELAVDGAPVESSRTWLYKGMMLSDVPNLAVALGYTNASWTLKCELTSRYVCRLLDHMDAGGYDWCVPRKGGDVGDEPLIDFSSGYIQRDADLLPRQGSRRPWRLYQNYALDLLTLKLGRLEDGAMRFGRKDARASAPS